MTTPTAVEVAFTYFRTRGIQHGDAATHAAALLTWAKQVQGREAAAQAVADRACRERDHALGQVTAVAAVVQAALDATDLDRPGALIAFVRAVAALPGVQGAVPAVRLGGAPSPRPRGMPA